jgi:hypothetical protein
VIDHLPKDATLQQDDRRHYNRARLIIDVFFNGADATGVASTNDISVGGLYMNTQVELPEGAMLTLRIPIEGEHIVVNAEVVYSNPGRGIGVRFQDLSEKHHDLIERSLVAP